MTDKKYNLSVEPLASVDPEIGRMLWMMEDTRNDTLKVVRDLSTEELDALPEGASNTIGALLYHTALVEAGWLYFDMQGLTVPDEWLPLFPMDSRDEQNYLSRMRGFGIETYLERLAIVRARLLEILGAMTIEDYRTARQPEGEDYECTPEWILHHLIQHETEHRGHIQVLVELVKHKREQ